MCHEHCMHQNALGSCGWPYAGPRPCRQETAEMEARQTDTLCPQCLEAGRGKVYLFEADGDRLTCHVCEVTYPAAEWVELLSEALTRSLDECDALRVEMAVVKAERDNLQMLSARSLMRGVA